MRLLPCLKQWQRELAAGDRTKTTFDALQQAAAAEAWAQDWYELRLPELAEKELRRAAEIILEEAA